MREYDNAFEILTSDPTELEDYKEKYKLAIQLEDFLKGTSLTYSELSVCLGLSYEEIEELSVGSMSSFTLRSLRLAVGKLGALGELNAK